MTIKVKCAVCGAEVDAKLKEWTKCPKCGQSMKPEYRLVVAYGREG